MADDLNLEAKKDEVELALRSVGIYVDEAHWHDPVGDARAAAADELDEEELEQRFGGAKKAYVLALQCYVGDVAFSDRVQDPEQYNMDVEFADIAREFGDQAFKDTQERVRKAIAEGRDPFEEGDDAGED